MRVTCESCNAQYNLPDEKVRGRRAKVRCKKCQASIVVDGTSLVPEPPSFEDDDEATQVMNGPALTALARQTAASVAPEAPGPDLDTWTVNLSETDQRELTQAELISGWLSGLVTDDAYVWREGMDDWAAIADVQELVDQINAAIDADGEQAQADTVEPTTPFRAPEARLQAAGTALNQAGPGPGADPEPARAPAFLGGPAERVFGHMPSIEETKPLDFGLAQPQAPRKRPAQGAGARRGPPPREKPGERSENSVVFSLNALTGAAGEPESPPEPERISEDLLMLGSVNPPAAAGAPLIQVQAPAPQAPLIDPQASAPGTMGSVSPAAHTYDYPEPKAKKSGILMLAIGVLAVGGAVVLGLFALGIIPLEILGGQAPSATKAAVPSAEPQPPKAPEPEPTVASSAAPESTAAPEASSTATSPESPLPASLKPSRDVPEKVSQLPPVPRRPAPPSRQPKPTEQDKPAEQDKPKAEVEQKPKPTEDPAKSPGDDPPTSSDEDAPTEEPEEVAAPPFNAGAAKTALKAAAARVQSCKTPDGPIGVGQVRITFAVSGRVTSANVSGAGFGGSAVGGCVARTFRRSRVPKFSGDAVTVSKSFRIE